MFSLFTRWTFGKEAQIRPSLELSSDLWKSAASRRLRREEINNLEDGYFGMRHPPLSGIERSKSQWEIVRCRLYQRE